MRNTVQEKIRLIRKPMKVTLRELSEKTGIDAGSLSRIERNLQPVKVADLEKIAAALNVPIARFFDESE